jgi:hypothetical protein
MKLPRADLRVSGSAGEAGVARLHFRSRFVGQVRRQFVRYRQFCCSAMVRISTLWTAVLPRTT